MRCWATPGLRPLTRSERSALLTWVAARMRDEERAAEELAAAELAAEKHFLAGQEDRRLRAAKEKRIQEGLAYLALPYWVRKGGPPPGTIRREDVVIDLTTEPRIDLTTEPGLGPPQPKRQCQKTLAHFWAPGTVLHTDGAAAYT
jgi:hypothetical protein